MIPWDAKPTKDDPSGSARELVLSGVDEDGQPLPPGVLPKSAARLLFLPYDLAQQHGCGPSITLGPNGRPWFCMLTGDGLIGTVTKCGHIKTFELFANEWNPFPRICNLKFDKSGTLYCISSDLLDKRATNSLIRVKFDDHYTEIIAQHEMAMPTQSTGCHRLEIIQDNNHPSIVVTELAKAQMLQVLTKTLPSLDQFPMKTIKLEKHKVYDAMGECPRAGTPVCACSGSGFEIAIPAEVRAKA